ncbi:MAG: type III pantothenate kinase [Bacteroidales bacterium]|nr:type III pantothenate kinase [Bacteroidales bacterium]
MLLTFDIGNTNIKAAVFNQDKVIEQWRISTDTKRTGDEYFALLRTLFKDFGLNANQIENVVVSSVVPLLIGQFVIVTQRLINKKPLIVGADVFKYLPIKVPAGSEHEIGGDLLCDAVQAWETFHSACIVADFGTALSFTAVDDKANIAGIAIAPGIGTALKSLFNNTAQLPSVPLEIPPSSLGTNTVECIQSGILYGYKGLVEGIVNQMKVDLERQYGVSQNNILTIATGGLNSILSPITQVFDVTDKSLTLNGLYTIAKYALK